MLDGLPYQLVLNCHVMLEMKNTCPFQSTSYKNLQEHASDILYYLLQIFKLHSLSEKKIFVTNFPFLTDVLKPATQFLPKCFHVYNLKIIDGICLDLVSCSLFRTISIICYLFTFWSLLVTFCLVIVTFRYFLLFARYYLLHFCCFYSLRITFCLFLVIYNLFFVSFC